LPKVVAALLEVADAAARLGQLLAQIWSHRISRSADSESRSVRFWAVCASAARASVLAVPFCDDCCLRLPLRFFFQQALFAAVFSVRLPSLQRSLQQHLEFGSRRIEEMLDLSWLRRVLVR